MIYILILLILLYSRTFNYKKIIDDNVPRSGYLREMTTQAIDYKFYEQIRPKMYFITNLFTLYGACLGVYLLWGFRPALLYALMPLNVEAGCWSVGNMYMTTVLFILTAYYFLITYTWGFIVSLIFYHFALHSTVSAIPYAFFVLFLDLPYPAITSWEVKALHFLVLALFLLGERFQGGLKQRVARHKDLDIKSVTADPSRVFVMIKVIGYYIYLCCWPSRLGFFHQFGKEGNKKGQLHKPNRMFWLMLCLIITFSALLIQLPQGIYLLLWFFLFIGVFGQFVQYGQFICERYIHIPLIAYCVAITHITTHVLPPQTYIILATLYFYRSHIYIPSWKNNMTLFSQSFSAFPYAEENANNLARWYVEHGQMPQAINLFNIALNLTQGNRYNLLCNLVGCYQDIQRYDLALECLEKVMKIAPESKKKELLEHHITLSRKLLRTNRMIKQMRAI